MVRVAALVVVVVLLMGMHRDAIAPSLRYSRVAEGNISLYAHWMWGGGFPAYCEWVGSDARANGRIRPLHGLYHTVPFVLTLVRNGDLFARVPGVPVRDRINGDLQTHVGFLMLSYAVATLAIAWLLSRLGGGWWSGVLFAVCAWSSLNLSENLLVFHCDSGEIGQILWLSLYLGVIAKAFVGESPSPSAEVAASVFLVLAYAMKETTVVLVPAVTGLLVLQLLRRWRTDRAYLVFCARHLALHLVLAVPLLAFVHACKSGDYVAQNYASVSPSAWRTGPAVFAMTVGLPIVRLFCVSVLLGTALSCLRNCGATVRPVWTEPLYMAGVLGAGLSVGFWLINLPWQAQLIKYYLPAYFFGSLGAVGLVLALANWMRRSGARTASLLWSIGVFAFVLSETRPFTRSVHAFYDGYYRYRKAVPVVAADAAQEAKAVASKPPVVCVVAGDLYLEGVLPFLRQINLLYGVNILQGGRPVHRVDACERNYFRIRPGAGVQMTLGRDLPGQGQADLVYVYREVVSPAAVAAWTAFYIRDEGFRDPVGLVEKYRRRN